MRRAIALWRRAQYALGATGKSRRHRQHNDRRGQRCGSGRYIQAHGAQWADKALAAHARLRLHTQACGKLRRMETGDILDRPLEGRALRRRQRGARGLKLGRADAQLA